MNKKTLGLAATLTVLLFGCGDGFEVPPQPANGEGWDFLVWAPTDYVAPGDSALLVSQGELDVVLETLRLDLAGLEELPTIEVDFESQVVLALSSDVTGECGDPVYLEISFTDTQILVEPFQSPADKDCTSVARDSVSLFAVDRNELPEDPIGIVVGNKAENSANAES